MTGPDTPTDPLADLLGKITTAVLKAREKHPRFAHDFEGGCRAVLSESLEFQSQAMLVTKPGGRVDTHRLARAEEESMHCITTHIRFLLREYAPQ